MKIGKAGGKRGAPKKESNAVHKKPKIDVASVLTKAKVLNLVPVNSM